MIPAVYATPFNSVPAVGGLSVTGDSKVWAFLWCATARRNILGPGGAPPPIGNVIDQATRTATSCFMRGLKETIRIETSTSTAWIWRRICFTMKGDYLLFDHDQGTAWPLIPANIYGSSPSHGYMRTLTRLEGGGMPPDQTNMFAQLCRLLFRGERDTDWNNPVTAPLENKHVSVRYDKAVTVASGNDSGVMRTYRRWHGMNKNLVYDDDEVAGGMRAGDFSVQGKAGMGDYYIVDLFEAPDNGVEDDLLTFRPETTLYWHEH